MKTQETSFPCPHCGLYFKPEIVTKEKAFMQCQACNTPYETNIRTSFNFRKFCSKIGSQPSRYSGFYTSEEKKIKKIFDGLGLREGLDYSHNVRCKNRRSYYWLDFLVYESSQVFEVSPSIWHKMWNRESSERRKFRFLRRNGFEVVVIPERTSRKENVLRTFIERRLKWKKIKKNKPKLRRTLISTTQ